MKIGFIGLGNMATAMIGGILQKGIVMPEQVIGSTRSEIGRRRAEEAFHITTVNSNAETAKSVDILVLSVKPQFYETVIEEIKDVITPAQIIISIAPGKTLAWLQDRFHGGRTEETTFKIVRCMPNTPALVGEGCTGVCYNETVTIEEQQTVMTILSGFGKASPVPEHLIDAVVGVSGSAPAYVFMFIEAMGDAAVAAGMPRAQAYEFAAQAVLGSAKMVLETGKHPGELKDMVCSPGGTTIQAVRVLEEKGFRSAVMEAMAACIQKSKEM
ncbi:MAG: pyrroline-5-carboxylate reductase [Lachnospiraceae bacterium]